MLSLQGNQCFISQQSFWGGGSSEEEERWVRQTVAETDSTSPQCRLKPEPCGRVRMTTTLQTLRSCWQAGSNHHHHLLRLNPPVPRAAVTRPFVQYWKQGHHREEHSTVTLYSNVQTAGDGMSDGAFVPTMYSICAPLWIFLQAAEPAVNHFHCTWSRASCLI